VTPLQILCALAIHHMAYAVDQPSMPFDAIMVTADEIKTLVRDGFAASRDPLVWTITDRGAQEAARVCPSMPPKRF